MVIFESSLVVYTFLSSILGFVGFANNNVPALVGSMILSPLLTPLTNMYNPELSNKGLPVGSSDSALLTIFLLSIFVFLLGICFGLIKNYLTIYPLETAFMKQRTQDRIIVGDFISTIVVGLGTAYAIQESNKIARIGLTLGIIIVPILILSGLYLGNYIFIIHENLNKKIKNKKLLTELENYHLINCFKFFCIFIINIGVTGLSFLFVSKFILGV